MADTTTNFGWSIPVENSNPWYAAFLSLMNEIDTELYGWGLDSGYNRGSSITVDTAAVTMTVPNNSNNAALALVQNDTNNNPAALSITNTGTGSDISLVSGGTIGSTANGDVVIAPNGTGITHLNSGQRVKSTTVSSSTYSTLVGDYLINVTYTATAPVTVTIDTDNVVANAILIILDGGGNASLNNITIATESTETISGESSWTIDDDYNSVTLWCDGSNWFII